MITQILKPLASLKLTVVLLAFAMVVVFTGTTAQKELGIWTVQSQYFHTFIAQVPLKNFFPLSRWGWENVPGRIFLPGGYTLLGLLLVNLLAAHVIRFKISWKRSGILLVHGGLILLLLGEIVTSLFQREGQMRIEEGQTVSYTYDIRTCELAVIDPSGEMDKVTAIGAGLLKDGASISHSSLPFSIRVDSYYPNSELLGPFQLQQAKLPPDTRPNAGVAAAQKFTLVSRPQVTGVAAQSVDVPGAVITIFKGTENLGTYITSVDLISPQTVSVDGKDYQLSLRFKREYRPYTLTLKDFRFDRYTGTEMARNFSSLVQLRDPARNEDREVLIWMNHPLRYAGETFYQSSFDSSTEKATVLQVVRNPGWLLPYVSCALVSVGLCVHFLIYLVAFINRLKEGRAVVGQTRAGEREREPILIPGLIAALCVLFIVSVGMPRKADPAFQLNQFAKVPVNYEGRVMPLDSLADNSLRIFSGRSTFSLDGKSQPAIRFLIDAFARPEKAVDYPIIRIDHPDIQAMLKLDANKKRYSFNEIMRERDKLVEQIQRVRSVPRDKQDLYQKKLSDLNSQLELFITLAEHVGTLFLGLPPRPDQEWQPLSKALGQDGGTTSPEATRLVNLLQSYRGENPSEFNVQTAEYLQIVEKNLPRTAARLNVETIFNRYSPFYYSMYLYVVVFLLVCLSWMGWSRTLIRAAFWALLVTLVFHTLGMIGRVYISGRPPVTNLYSSAIFIAWGAALFCAVIEKIYRNGIGSLAAAVIAGPSLIIAHYLAGDGDTMRMLVAVLDTNFWLATHVIIVTLGYAATFLAGILGCVYVLGGVFTPTMNVERRQVLSRIIYGVIAFAVLFSFVGTVLGGIWADQSWGRFWGWDPKENGAVLIVIWNALILHARWSGMARERGVANLTIVGNIVTAWSWFGTNMMGVGLHSYGFMDSAVFWLAVFAFLQLAIMMVGCLPLSVWWSMRSVRNVEPVQV